MFRKFEAAHEEFSCCLLESIGRQWREGEKVTPFCLLNTVTFLSLLPCMDGSFPRGTQWGWAARAISFERLLFFPPAKIKRARGHGEYKKSDLITMDTHYKQAGRRCRWNEKGKVSQEIFPMRKIIRRINI